MKNRKFSSLLNRIVRNKTHCYFISPHLDDAALSAGGLISYLAKKKVPVTVVNIFTKIHKDKPTISANAFVKQSGYKNASNLFSERRREDKKLFKKIGANVINLGFIDVMWRKKVVDNQAVKLLGKLIPELVHVYPTYRFHAWIGKVSKEDKRIKTNLNKKLEELVRGRENYMIFCPVAIGKYIDHVIVRDVCAQTFDKVIYWSDFNYSMEFTGETKFIGKKKLDLAFFDQELPAKKKLIESYKSQISAIFPHGKVPILPDFFYF